MVCYPVILCQMSVSSLFLMKMMLRGNLPVTTDPVLSMQGMLQSLELVLAKPDGLVDFAN